MRLLTFDLSWGEQGDIVLRLFAAFLAASLIGFQRERAEKPAGLRTHILVSVGSCVMTLVSLLGFTRFGSDPARITAQIVSGVGFLGAGTIFRYGWGVTGLTTAASLWATCGIGIAFGSGLYFLGSVGTGFVIFTLVALRYVESFRKGITYLSMRLLDRPGSLGSVASLLGNLGVDIKNVELKKGEEKDSVSCIMGVHIPPRLTAEKMVESLQELEVVRKIEVR